VYVLKPLARESTRPEPSLVIDDTILELLPTAVYVCSADGVVVRYNRKAAELWGRSPRPGDTNERFCGSSDPTAGPCRIRTAPWPRCCGPASRPGTSRSS
jgi:PAS domain-containing protein